MIAVSNIARVFEKLAGCLPKQNWFDRERLRRILEEAVYGPSRRTALEDEKAIQPFSGDLGPVVALDYVDGPDEPQPK